MKTSHAIQVIRGTSWPVQLYPELQMMNFNTEILMFLTMSPPQSSLCMLSLQSCLRLWQEGRDTKVELISTAEDSETWQTSKLQAPILGCCQTSLPVRCF